MHPEEESPFVTYAEALAEGKLNGRRLQRLYEQSRYRLFHGNPNASQTVSMASRRLRREIQGKRFIPVYGYTGPKPDPEEFNLWKTGTWVDGKHVYGLSNE